MSDMEEREQTSRYWLGQACMKARERADIPRATIAGELRVSDEKLRNFEAGNNCPQDLDRVVAVYAAYAKIDDVLKIFDEAQALRRAKFSRVEPAPLAAMPPLKEPPRAPSELLGQKRRAASPKAKRRGRRAS